MKDDLVNRLWARIDAANAEDPRRVLHEGREIGFEERHADLAAAWVLRLRPEASPALRIAARGQHVRRWTIPRADYPKDRTGYLRWRETLKRLHAATLAEFLREEGATAAIIERVQALVLKKNIKGDPETQTLEDALCLTFLQTECAQLRASTDPEKFGVIVRKTWAKMSAKGQEAALGLPLPSADLAAIQEALSAKA